ncbi:MAG: sensor histidine kinase [Clostridia bacterium]|nr:sensor histidine kinase [Clostridia bacterium]
MKLCKSKKQTTMTFHLWRDFVMFAVIIMIVLWLLQVIFLNAFYEGMKKNEIEKIGNELVDLYSGDNENFASHLERYSFRSGFFAHVLSEDGSIITSPQPMREFQRGPDAPRHPKHSVPNNIQDFNSATWDRFVKKVNSTKSKTTTYVIDSPGNIRTMVYGARLGDFGGEGIYLYVSSPLQPMDTTRQVLQNQLIIVSVISVLLSLILAYFIAKRFSKPIIKASKSAQKLAEGRYDVYFEGGSYREITNLADVLNEAAKELGKLEELRLDLMANVSHDLKTPLTIIKSYAEMIKDISGDNKEKREEHTQVIIDETNRLSGLVNDILSLSKLQSGILEPEFSSFVISDSVKSVLEKFSVYVQKEDYVISCDIQDDIKVCADETQVMQVIYNLVGNAINYTGKSKEIFVSLKTSNGFARFEVKDCGDGIEECEIPYVWDRYYRTGRSHTRDTAGTGLGLSIVKHILESHKANYGVKSEVGKGSVFWFELPLE